MAVKEISRHFDPHVAAEIVTLENALGVRHILTVHITGHESCPACGHLLHKPGVVDVDAVIRQAVVEFEAHEKKLTKHLRKRTK